MSIKSHFGFNESHNQDREDPNHIAHGYLDLLGSELVELRKRIKKAYPLAKFRRITNDGIGIILTPQSMCLDATVQWIVDAYVVKTVSTNRERSLNHDDMQKYGISWNDAHFTNITTNIARAVKIVKETRSVTPERALELSMQKTVTGFCNGLIHAQKALSNLQRQVFQKLYSHKTEEALLEYCLAGMEQRSVRADIQENIEGHVNEYLQKKKDLGESVAACDGLQTLALFKLENIDKVFFHYRDTTAGEMYRVKHVNDVNELPQEVLAKLSVLQTTGIDTLERVDSIRVLPSIGGVFRADYYAPDFLEDAMCVYVTPETMAEVEAIVGY